MGGSASRYHTLLAVSLLVSGCTSTAPAPVPPPALEGVEIALDHRGSLLDLGQLRIIESGEPDRPIGHGEDFWLRLSNRSPFTISFPTQSVCMSRPPELVRISPTHSAFAVAAGAFLVVLFEGYDGRYGFGHTSSTSFLPSGRSVLFQVPERYLRKEREIHVEILAYTEAVLSGAAEPQKHRVVFRAGQLAPSP